MPVTVSHYGLHRSSHGIAFLEQQRFVKEGTSRREPWSQTAMMIRIPSPFRVRITTKVFDCNHSINLDSPPPTEGEWETFMDMVNSDPLVRAMLPIPKDPAELLYCPQWPSAFEYLTAMSQMTHPFEPYIKTLWNWTARQVVAELWTTNIQPFVLMDSRIEDVEKMEQIAVGQRGAPRSLILLGETDLLPPPQYKMIKSGIRDRDLAEFRKLNWKALGAQVVRKVMRNEGTFDST